MLQTLITWKIQLCNLFNNMSSSTKSHLPTKVVFHRRLSFTKQRSSSTDAIFHRRLSSTEGRRPPKVVLHLPWHLSWSYICENSLHTKSQPPTLLRSGLTDKGLYWGSMLPKKKCKSHKRFKQCVNEIKNFQRFSLLKNALSLDNFHLAKTSNELCKDQQQNIRPISKIMDLYVTQGWLTHQNIG